MKYIITTLITLYSFCFLSAQEKLEVDGAISVQKAVGTGLGTIEYNGSMDDFRGRTTTGWKSLTSGTGGSSLWTALSGGHIGYTNGNVAIGGTSVTGSMLSLEGNTQSMLRLQGTGSGGAYQQFFSNGSYWGLIGDENGDGSDLYFDIKSRSGAAGIAMSTGSINNAVRIENNGQVNISNLPAGGATDQFVTADASGNLRKVDRPSVIEYFLSLPNGIQTLLSAGETPLNIINAGASLSDFIGRNHAGGIIFYMDPSADGTGLVSAESDQSIFAQWGCHGTSISGADGTAIGTGNQNTLDINAGCLELDIAADICVFLSLNRFTDWFLPSKDELNEMYTKIGQGAAAPNTNIGNFADAFYWSSSEFNVVNAWEQDFSNGSQNFFSKNESDRVRAIRAF